MDSHPDYVSLALLTLIGAGGGLAGARVLWGLGLPDTFDLVVGVGGMLGLAWWCWWDVEIKGRVFPKKRN